VGISLGWDSSCDDRFACYDYSVCAPGNDSSGNGLPNAPAVHYTTSECSYSINNGGDGCSVDEKAGVKTAWQYIHRLFNPRKP
jgi:hypothetical protein